MTLTIELAPDVEDRLRAEAAQRGLDPSAYVKEMLRRELGLPLPVVGPPDQATLDLFAKWEAEDAIQDPAELESEKRDWEEIQRSMNENHSSNRVLFP